MEQTRLDRVCQEMRQAGFSQIIVSDPSSIRYLTGIYIEPMERLFALLIRTDGAHCLFLNRMFTVGDTPIRQVWMDDTDDCIGIVAQNIMPEQVLGVDKDWPARFVLGLMERLPQLRCRVSSRCIDRVRARKDADECEKMRRASRVNDEVMLAVEAFLHEGVTEKQVAQFIASEYARHGAQSFSFPAIVSFGGHAADPHHIADDTPLAAGDCIVIDMGCKLDGYCSDMTRTFFCGAPKEKHAAIHDLVREANELALSMIRPGVRFCDLDAAARDYIAKGGYGPYFTHRLGHFIGTDCHEAGDVSATNEDVLEVGNTFSIEPGVYLPDEFGVRIEDLVIVTQDGCEILNHVDKHWHVV